MDLLVASARLILATFAVCVVGYVAVVLGLAQLMPASADGSLILQADGTVIGSRLIGQRFASPRYFWPRPSAAGYDARAGAGSNKSPASDDLRARARERVERHGAGDARPLPADLAAASGSGLDPHISERAALYQVPRVAQARDIAPARVEALVRQHATSSWSAVTRDGIVNVLELNLALDRALDHAAETP